MPGKKRILLDEEKAKKCVTCSDVKMIAGVFHCLRRRCKYETSKKSRHFRT